MQQICWQPFRIDLTLHGRSAAGFNFASLVTSGLFRRVVCRLPTLLLLTRVKTDRFFLFVCLVIRLPEQLHQIAHRSAPTRANRTGRSSSALAPERPSDPLLFNDRELSFLRFQGRVFEEAQDDTIPLLDRVKFLAIVGTHVDDFVRVRAPELRRSGARRMLVESMLKHLVYTLEVYWRRRLLPALRAAGIHIVDYRRLTLDERAEADAHFADVVYPALAPLECDRTRAFPQVASLGMNLMVRTMAAGGERRFVLRIPDALPSLVPLHTSRVASGTFPVEKGNDSRCVWLDQVWWSRTCMRSFPRRSSWRHIVFDCCERWTSRHSLVRALEPSSAR